MTWNKTALGKLKKNWEWLIEGVFMKLFFHVSFAGDVFTIKNFIGEKVTRTLNLKKGADVKIQGNEVIVESSDKEIASQTAADIEQLTRRTGYDRRIFQDGIYIFIKDGKEIT